MQPKGYELGTFRIIVEQPLVSQFLQGLKWASSRGWCESQEMLLRRSFETGKLVRLQSNWAHNTIFAWGIIDYITRRGTPTEVVTRATVVEAGCGDMTTEAYCTEYLGKCDTAFTFHFNALWTAQGDPIVRHLSMPPRSKYMFM